MAKKQKIKLKSPEDILRESKDDEEERASVRRELALDRVKRSQGEWKRLAVQAKKELEIAETRIDTLLAMGEPRSPIKFKPTKRQKKSQSIPIMIASDWHVEEEVGEETAPGALYTLDVAEERIYNFGKNSLTLVNAARAHTEVKEGILLLLGDHYTGHIHEELVETTSLSPVESILWLRERISALIHFLQDNGDFEKLTVVGKIGNHSRTTLRPRISTAHKHSFEWLLYHVLAAEFEKDKTIDWVIEPTYHTILDVYGMKIRVHHGDWSGRYQGGIGGLAVPLSKSHLKWNQDPHLRADRDIMGHWHSFESSTGKIIVNGSLIGPNKFGIKVQSHERPLQSFSLISSKFADETIRAPVFVE